MNDKHQDKDKTLRGEPLFEDIQILEEGSAAEKPNTRLLKISGTASRGGIINRNGRLYPTEVLNRAVERAQSALRKGKFVGEVDHPEYGGGRLRRLAMKFTKVWMEGADMKFEADILPTASGEILKTLLISGVGIGMSTRGWGSTIRRTSGDKSYLEVQDDFELKGIDAVLDESNPHGTISKYEEGVLGMELTLAELKEKFGYQSVMEVPRLTKITLNMGVGEAVADKKVLDNAVADLTKIAGQKPVVTKAKKAIAGFKIREGQAIGCMVTLRGVQMYEFLDRFVTVALPRVRDFRGISGRSFDGRGIYNVGVKEQIIFPEIEYDKVDALRGLNISITTTAKTDDECKALLAAFKFPFKN